MRAWTGVWERETGKGVGGARLHCIVKVRKPGPWMPRGEESQRQSGSSSRRPLGGSVRASETRFPLPLLPQGAGLARPQPGESACIGGVMWALGEEEEHMTSSRGGPQEQPATPLVHTCAPLAAKGLPHYLKTASKQKIIWTS